MPSDAATAVEVLPWAVETFGATFAIVTSYQKEGTVVVDPHRRSLRASAFSLRSQPPQSLQGYQRYLNRRTASGRKVLWSRGNGWPFAGIARVLEYLPKEDPQRPEYLSIFKKMAAELAKRQGSDGLWRPNLDDPDDIPFPETSGSGFFCFGLAWGINEGVLDRSEYLPTVGRAWAALTRNVSPEGKVLWGQQEDGQPNMLKQDSTHEYVTGTFLLAGSEVFRLVDRRP